MCRTIFMKIRKCQIIRKLFNNFFFTFMFTCFLLFFLHVSLFFKYLFVCFVLFLSISWCLIFFVVVIYLKNSQLITKVGENRLNLKKNKFQIGIIQSSVSVNSGTRMASLPGDTDSFTLFFWDDKVYNQRRL